MSTPLIDLDRLFGLRLPVARCGEKLAVDRGLLGGAAAKELAKGKA